MAVVRGVKDKTREYVGGFWAVHFIQARVGNDFGIIQFVVRAVVTAENDPCRLGARRPRRQGTVSIIHQHSTSERRHSDVPNKNNTEGEGA